MPAICLECVLRITRRFQFFLIILYELLMKLTLLTVHHKKDNSLDIFSQFFNPIQVGSAGTNDLGILKDSYGDNISNKNKFYSELTAHYYLYKNIDSEYYGLMHYRRIFCEKPSSFFLIRKNIRFFRRIIFSFFLKKNIALDKNVSPVIPLKKLPKVAKSAKSHIVGLIDQGYELIVPKPLVFHATNVYQNYSLHHSKLHLDLFCRIIEEKYPCLSNPIKEVNNSYEIIAYNMFVMKKEIFVEYSSMLFDVLFELEKRINLDELTPYQQRIFGFLSERFFNYFFIWKRDSLKYCYAYVCFINE